MNAVELTAEIVARIQLLLDQKGLTKADLSRATDIQPPHITALMRGTKATSLDTITRIAAALGVHPRELLAEVPKKSKK